MAMEETSRAELREHSLKDGCLVSIRYKICVRRANWRRHREVIERITTLGVEH